MTVKALLAAAVVIALALSPSVGEVLSAHRDDTHHRWILSGWVLLVIVLALSFGEEMFGAA